MNVNIKSLALTVLIVSIPVSFGIFLYQKIDKQLVKIADQATWSAKKQFSQMTIDFKKELATQVISEPSSRPSDLSSKWMDIERKSRNAVVQVRSNMFEINWVEPFRAPETAEGIGSGFIINTDGDVLTNFHVVGNSVRVQLQILCLGKERISASVTGVSPERDIALLRINPDGIEKIKSKLGELPFLEFGSSDSIKRGTEVMALGYPLSKDNIKSTLGSISGWEKVKFGERDFGQICIETTAPINPGSSGGPSLSSDGKVIGINFAGIVGAQNVGYVIPSDDIIGPIKDLYNTKLLRKMKLGYTTPQPSSPALNKFLGNPEEGGVYLTKVLKDTVAERSGLKEGDVIYQINGHQIDRFGEITVPWNEDKVHFTDLINRYAEGDKLDLIIYRHGNRKEIKITLEDPGKPPRIRIVFPGYEVVDYEIFGGAVFMELVLNHLPLCEKNPKILKFAEIENRDDSVLIVTHVMPTSVSQAMRGVISPGFIVDDVNGIKVSNLGQLREQIKNSLKSQFLRIKSEDKQYVVYDVSEVLEDETRLAQMFLFDPTHSLSLKYALEKENRGLSWPTGFGYGQTIARTE